MRPAGLRESSAIGSSQAEPLLPCNAVNNSCIICRDALIWAGMATGFHGDLVRRTFGEGSSVKNVLRRAIMSVPVSAAALLSSTGTGLAAVAAPEVPVAQHIDGGEGGVCVSEARANAKPWTLQEMRASVPFTPANFARALAKLTHAQRRDLRRQSAEAVRRGPCGGDGHLMAASPRVPASSAPRVSPTARRPDTGHAQDYRTIGKFFFNVAGILHFNCTAATVNSNDHPNSNLVLTAAHCFNGDYGGVIYNTDDWQFAPDWSNNNAPYGMWQVYEDVWPRQWDPSGDGPLDGRYDYAVFITKYLNAHSIGSQVGLNGWNADAPNTGQVTIFGVPGNSSYMLENVTTAHGVHIGGYDYRTASTPGFADGASGGPWFSSYSNSSELGIIIADTGGYDAGGPTSSPSYSSFWGSTYASLVANASSIYPPGATPR